MSELSSAAKAIDDAFWKTINDKWNIYDRGRAQLAASLEAVADQLLPEPDYWDEDNMSQQGLLFLRLKRAQLLAIAAELRGDTTNQEDCEV